MRLDTSETLADVALGRELGENAPRGVAPELVLRTREALDAGGFGHVRIVVSGGFTADRIAAFEEAGVPVDAYGVGSSLIRGANDFTADVREGRGPGRGEDRQIAPSKSTALKGGVMPTTGR